MTAPHTEIYLIYGSYLERMFSFHKSPVINIRIKECFVSFVLTHVLHIGRGCGREAYRTTGVTCDAVDLFHFSYITMKQLDRGGRCAHHASGIVIALLMVSVNR